MVFDTVDLMKINLPFLFLSEQLNKKIFITSSNPALKTSMCMCFIRSSIERNSRKILF